jgi:hypothetical protein
MQPNPRAANEDRENIKSKAIRWRGPHHLNPDERTDQIKNNREAEVRLGSGGGRAKIFRNQICILEENT